MEGFDLLNKDDDLDVIKEPGNKYLCCLRIYKTKFVKYVAFMEFLMLAANIWKVIRFEEESSLSDFLWMHKAIYCVAFNLVPFVLICIFSV